MRTHNRFATCLLAVLLVLATVAPAAAVGAADADRALPRVSVTALWDWFVGLLVAHTGETKGQVVPEGASDEPTPPETPLAPPAPEPVSAEVPQA